MVSQPMENEHGSDREASEAEEDKKEDPQEDRNEAPQVKPKGATGPPAKPPPGD